MQKLKCIWNICCRYSYDIYNVILNNIKNTNKVYDNILAQNIQPNYKSIVLIFK